MEKINLLKPNVETGYLSNGKGQEITYLKVDPDLNRYRLAEDINNGATYMREVFDLMTKKQSRVVAVKCKSREEGLLAVSYIASYYNERDDVDPEDYDSNDENINEEQDLRFEDFNDKEDFENFEPDFGNMDDGEPDDWEQEDMWEETPWKIPIIEMDRLCYDNEMGNGNPFFNNGMVFGREANNDNRIPYWRYTRKESICVVYEYGATFGCYRPFAPDAFKRYRNNRHIYVLVIDPNAEMHEKFQNEHEDDEEDAMNQGVFFDSTCGYEAPLTQFVLENSADIISVHHNGDNLEKYYRNLFENWVAYYGFGLAKDFPVSVITKKIVAMDNACKSDMIDKVISYVIKDIDKKRELKEEDFNVLYKLRGLGFKKKVDEKEHLSIRKLQESLIGMDEIKNEITAIVETFKYNRRRKAAGLHTGGYHNVHMMLGAPGTAKTTVARLVGEIMAEERLLKSNRFISVNGAELKGMYVGHSAPKVKSLFENYDIIFIDEAYAVATGIDGDTDSFSQEAISQLIIELENHGMDRLVIFAGYGGPNVSAKDNKMLNFLNCNPGIRSRINSTMFFDSYNADQMVAIFRGQAKMNQYRIPKAADKYVHDFFEARVHDSDFGNGREARSLLENATVKAAQRISAIPDKQLTKNMLQQITVEDVKGAIERMRTASLTQKGINDKKAFGFNV